MKKHLVPTFVAAAAVDALGTGLYLTIYATFAVQVIGLSVGQAGAVLSVAGLVGLLGALPVVALLDRIQPYRLLICIYIVRAAGYAVIALGRSELVFIVATPLVGIFDRASGPTMQAVIADGFTHESRTAALVRLRSWRNVGFVCGALVGTLVFIAPDRLAYNFAILFDSLSFVAAAAGFASVARSAPGTPRGARQQRRGMRDAIRNRRYLTLAGLHGMLGVHGTLLTFALPLWITERTRAPHWVIPVLIACNCCLAIAFQRRASRGSEKLGVALAISVRAGLALVLCTATLVLAHWLTAWAAVVFLAAAVSLITFAEIWQAAGAATLSLDLAPQATRGSHLSVFGFFGNLQGVVMPFILATCIASGGIIGMALFGVAMAVTAGLVALVRLPPQDDATPMSSATPAIGDTARTGLARSP
jgi:hypothetical protein